ncbi:hypothetical protein NQ644_18755, partial [Acinetobacter baumannii]|nr:hypothetical protein [Acinetobacter baumannii]
MLTILVEVIMSVFIANFKASEHPIVNIIVRGVIIDIVVFLLAFFSSIKNNKDFSFLFGLSASFICGLFISLFFFLIDKFFYYFY